MEFPCYILIEYCKDVNALIKPISFPAYLHRITLLGVIGDCWGPIDGGDAGGIRPGGAEFSTPTLTPDGKLWSEADRNFD